MTSVGPCFMNWNRNDKSNISLIRLIDFIITYNNGIRGWCKTHIENLKKITTNCNNYIDDKYSQLLADFNKKRELKNIMDMLKILKKLDKIHTEIKDKIYMHHDYEDKVSDGKLAEMSLLFSKIEKEDNIDEINKTLSQSMYKDDSNSYKDTIKYMYDFFDVFPLSYNNKALYKKGSLKSINTINDDEVNAFINDFLKLQERAFIRRKVVDIISDIISDIIDESKQKKDEEGRVYYEYNDEKYYFTNNKGEYDDSKIIADIKKDENGKVYYEYKGKIIYSNYKGEDDDSIKDISDKFFASLKNLNKNEIDMHDFSKDTSDEIDWLIGVIQALSPTQLGENNMRHKLYDAVYENVEKGQNEQKRKKANGGKRISKGKSNKVAKKPVVSQKKQSVYKEIFGKQMKIYKMPDSRKEYVKYKGELHPISEYKSLMKQKAMAKAKAKK